MLCNKYLNVQTMNYSFVLERSNSGSKRFIIKEKKKKKKKKKKRLCVSQQIKSKLKI